MNAVVKMKLSPNVLLKDAAKNALQKSNGNLAIAAAQVRAIVERDPALKQELLEPYYDRAILRLLRKLRPPTTRPAAAAPAREPEIRGIEQLAKSNLTDYLSDYRLWTGKMLGNAKRYDLIQEAQYRRDSARSQAVHYRFITRLTEYMREGNTVRDQFDNERLARLMREAEQEKTTL